MPPPAGPAIRAWARCAVAALSRPSGPSSASRYAPSAVAWVSRRPTRLRLGTRDSGVPGEVVSLLDDRKLAVLRAIVEDYVSTTEPVGSKSLVDRHNLDVSPATIRNDMAVLEEQGYIVQPHTSAGRVPTDKGYRLFVDRLSGVKPLSPPARRALETFLAGAYDLDDVVMRTVRLLAQLTRQVAVVQYPSLTRSSVRHVELVPVGAQRLLLVVITTNGRVEQRTIETFTDVTDDSIAHLRALLNASLDGRQLG